VITEAASLYLADPSNAYSGGLACGTIVTGDVNRDRRIDFAYSVITASNPLQER
jgi:hypothetical protein